MKEVKEVAEGLEPASKPQMKAPMQKSRHDGSLYAPCCNGRNAPARSGTLWDALGPLWEALGSSGTSGTGGDNIGAGRSSLSRP